MKLSQITQEQIEDIKVDSEDHARRYFIDVAPSDLDDAKRAIKTILDELDTDATEWGCHDCNGCKTEFFGWSKDTENDEAIDWAIVLIPDDHPLGQAYRGECLSL
jgi:hypothetical protein